VVGGLSPIDVSPMGTVVAWMGRTIMTINIVITCDTCGTKLELAGNKPEAFEIYQRSGGMVSPFTGFAACNVCAAEIRAQHPSGRTTLNR